MASGLAYRAGSATGYPPFEIPFPINGIDQSQPRSKQNQLTCTNALNVVGFPPIADRIGGGKREGSRRALSDQMTNGSASKRILGMNAVPAATTPPSATDSLATIYPHGTGATSPIPAGSWVPIGAASLHACTDDAGDFNTSDYAQSHPAITGQFGAAEFRVTMESAGGGPAAGTLPVVRFTYRIAGSGVDSRESYNSSSSAQAPSGTSEPPVHSPPVGFTPPSPLVVQPTFNPAEPPTVCSVQMYVSVYYNVGAGDVFVRDYQGGAASSGGWVTESFSLTQAESDLIDGAGAYSGDDKIVIAVSVAVAGPCGNVFIDVTQIAMVLQAAGGPPPPNYVTPGLVLALQDTQCYVGDLDADTISTAAVTTLANAFPQIDYWSGLWYCVDGGTQQTIDATPTVANWTAATAGTIPAKCRLVCFYRDRAVLANQNDVANGETFWFMSAIGDPEDWAYGADDIRPAEDSAVAGSNHFLGKPSDAILALIPWNDDCLIFGGASSMWMLTGDPGYGGTLMNHTQETGVLGARAWCFDEESNLWFMGSGGLYKNPPGGKPIPVSGRRLYRFLDRLDGASNLVQLSYDAFSKHIHIFMTPLSGVSTPNSFHIRYDIVNNAFWFEKYPDVMGPFAVCQLTGSKDDDRRFLMGGNDGYIRRPFDGGKLDSDGNIGPTGTDRYGTADDMTRTGEDGQPIESSVRFAPIEFPLGDREVMATELVAYGTDNNLPLAIPFGTVTWYWLTGDSCGSVAEKALNTAVRSGSWFGSDNVGQQLPVGLRESAGAHQLVIRHHSGTTAWAMDRIVAKFTPGARRR